jgi:putative membrane protein
MTHPALCAAGLVVLAAAWFGPLPLLARGSFAAHMTMHMAVVAVAAPLLAFGIAHGRFDPARRAPVVFAPIAASIAELVVVWAWHMPLLHQAARHQGGALVLEQASFLAAGLFLWVAAIGGDAARRGAAGIAALLFTSMHMTLLGALFALAPRPLYAHAPAPGAPHLGGVIRLLVGGAAYLAGGLWLTARVLAGPAARDPEESWSGARS